MEFTEGLSVAKLAAALALPLFGLWCVRTRYKAERFRALLSSDFIVSAIPIAIILWACVRACFVHYNCHIFEPDSKKISVSMTREQVIQILGDFRSGSGDPDLHFEKLDYDIQRPFGYEPRQFHVRLHDGKVSSTIFYDPLSVYVP